MMMSLKYLFFNHVENYIGKKGSETLTQENINRSHNVDQVITVKGDWRPLKQSLSRFRKSTLLSIIKNERKPLFSLFMQHMSSVMLTLIATFFSIQVLKSFTTEEEGFRLAHLFGVPPGPPVVWFAVGLAILAFGFKLLGKVFHIQKAHKEHHIYWEVQAKGAGLAFEAINHMSYRSRQKYKGGDILNIAQQDIGQIAQCLAFGFVDIPVLFVASSLILGALYYTVGSAAFMGIGVALLQVPVSLVYMKLSGHFHYSIMKRRDKRISIVTEWIQGMRPIRYNGWSSDFKREVDHSAKKEVWKNIQFMWLAAFVFTFSDGWWIIVSISTMAAVYFLGGSLDVVSVFGIIWLASILGGLLKHVPWFIASFSRATISAKRLQRVLSEPMEWEEYPFAFQKNPDWLSSVRESPEKYRLSYYFKDVSVLFQDSQRYGLKDISVEIAADKMTAIIGAVGSGKSIFLQVLLGEVKPTHGSVFVCAQHRTTQEQHEVNLHTREGLELIRALQSYCSQEAYVASALLNENVPLAYRDMEQVGAIQEGNVLGALFKAQMQQDLQAMPHGVNTELGERGVNLSGGQRQRLSLSRSFYSQKSILLLDDPLSAVDTKTEAKLAEALFARAPTDKPQTVVWVTHRYSFLHLAHKVLFLREGKLVEVCTGDELMGDKESEIYKMVIRNS